MKFVSLQSSQGNLSLFEIIMHQSIPTAPSHPWATANHLPAFSVPGVGHLQILRCPGVGYWQTPGLFPSFLSKRLAKDHCKIGKLKQNTLRRLTKFSPYLRKNKNALSMVSLACLKISFVVKGAGAVILLFRLEFKTRF